ncbi:hypothetical protein XFF6992_90012 [Xanthomonas citri pv. fuscans]|uniref:Uncharacterized protein n=1 Tax=Xanthomonas campestris pv. phaseoli TaxID=317013 RepID=A0A2H1PYH7_XANCH|nr:hypothetical protein XAP6984_50002 [Xanthomonas phaseoli pv. phaseoli]SON93476.1 hypothetical protein XFF6990_100004 [Xanthomonas citri pv. fuscans]SON85140.1 hypothetical protein XAP412_40002 [Xanthomonas phaseoli pv. phaseoli]SON88825.1 hypothetical protein XAP7430_40003 [Xanthomonas phaseoli pv. phaseoli]SOO21987.1 hypothetical protein XFF6992_90012 [Xanthomonas citri pv. fuscans]
MAWQLRSTNSATSPQVIPRGGGELALAGVVEGVEAMIEAAAEGAASLIAADWPAWTPVFAASGRGTPAGTAI